MIVPVIQSQAKSHLSLFVKDLDVAVNFYRILFGIEPQKCHADYAKFELEDPPVVFALQPGPQPAGASLSHIGLRFRDEADVLAVQERIKSAGIPFTRQDGVICGYSRQSKCWVVDPDQNHWEIYVLEHDVDPESVRACLRQLAFDDDENRLDEKVLRLNAADTWPKRFPQGDGTIDRIDLEQTVNQAFEQGLSQLWKEVGRVLRAGGSLRVRGIASNQSLGAAPDEAPGWIRQLSSFPTLSEIIHGLRSAGFTNVQIANFDEKPAWRSRGVTLHEFEIQAQTPVAGNSTAPREVLYKGPLREVIDGSGHKFSRGQRVKINEQTWNNLRRSPCADQFLFFVQGATATCGGDQSDIR